MTKEEHKPVDAELDPFDLPAPQWVTKMFYFSRLGLGLFLALSLALSLLLSGCGARAAEFWSPALGLLNAEQISTMIADHSSSSLTNIPDGWVEKVKAHQEGNFYLIDFNSDRLCGRLGCLYVGYLFNEEEQKLSSVLNIYFHPELPRGVPLFEIDMSRDVQPPCLEVHQFQNFNKLVLHTFCFNGTEYVKESTIAQPIPQNAN
jgi:hypothetical protein